MLKTRVIPTMLWKDFGLVKGVSFDSWRRVGTVLPSIRVYTLRQVDEIIFVDISASIDKREPDFESIEEFTDGCSVPITVGGGVSKLDHITKLLRCGADKVAINSACYRESVDRQSRGWTLRFAVHCCEHRCQAQSRWFIRMLFEQR